MCCPLYADVEVLISNNMEDQSLVFRMNEVCANNELMLSVSKYTVMVFKRNSTKTVCSIGVNYEYLVQVSLCVWEAWLREM